MQSKIILTFVMLLVACNFLSLIAQERVGIVEKLGENIPLDLTFTDEENNKIALKGVIDKPTILALVYYRCPGICTPLLNELQKVVEKIRLEPGKDFRVLSISFDPTEPAEMANVKKHNYLQGMKRRIPADAWRFFVGDSDNVNKIKETVGYYAKFDTKTNEYLHEGVLIILSPEGKVTRYIYLSKGFLPLDVEMALVQAKNGETSPSILQYQKWCQNPNRVRENKQKTLIMTTIAGAGILLVLGLFVKFVVLKSK